MDCVIVPTYNESENVAVLIPRLLELDADLHVLIVDDSSPDGTAQVASDAGKDTGRVFVLVRTGKRGYAPASIEGLRWAAERGYERVCSMDADLSHDPDVLPRLLDAVAGDADVAIGSRYVPGGGIEVDWGWFRRAVSRTGSAYARTLLGLGVKDCTSGFRCYSSECLNRVDLAAIRSEGYSFLVELLFRLSQAGACVREVPITYVDRERGASKISKRIIFEALWRVTALGLSRIVRPNRTCAGKPDGVL